MQYLAYSSPASSCSEAHKADFLEAGVDSLLQVKGNRLEVYTLEATGLRLAVACSLFGTVLRSVPVKLRNVSTAALAVLTVDLSLFLVSFTPDGKTQTLASHSVNERGASRSEDFVTLLAGKAASDEEYTKFLVIHTFQGLVRFILLDEEEKKEKRRASKAGKEDIVDLTRGFTTRIQELLLNAMSILPPFAGSTSPRLATVHTDRQGQRVLQFHTLNLASKSLEPEDTDLATAFLPKTGTVLADPDSEILIPVNNEKIAGLIVVGQDTARFVHTGRSGEGLATEKAAGMAETSIPEDGDEDMQTSPGKSVPASPGKNSKGKGRELPSPTAAAPAGGQPIPAAARRRSSASSQVGQLAISPPSMSLGTSDPRSGNKRKLSESANSSGRGKSTAREKTSKVIECNLPICRYVAYSVIDGEPNKFLLVDEWGKAILLKVTIAAAPARRRTSSLGQSAATLATSPPSSSAVLATSPTSPTTPRARRGSRSSFSGGSSTGDRLPSVKISWEPVSNGKVSSPSSLISLGGGFVFVGSHFGDSLLVRLSSSSIGSAEDGMQIDDGAKAQGSGGELQLDILNTYTNLAPIVDFCLVETDDGKGPSHIVTCSGGKDDGTLRVVRHGVGLTELAALDMEGVQRIWTLSSTGDQASQDLLVLSYINSTRVLQLTVAGDDAGIEEIDALGSFDMQQATLAACSIGSHIIQVTATGVFGPAGSWQPEGNKQKIALAASSEQYILLASGSNLILLLVNEQGQLEEVAKQTLENEIACLDISKLHDQSGEPYYTAVAGLWNSYSVVVLSIPDLQLRDTVKIETTYLLRSVALVDFSEDETASLPYLFVGLGDGSVVSYGHSEGEDGRHQLSKGSKKTVALGSRPITMSRIRTGGNAEAGIPAARALFIISDRSTIVSLDNGKLAYASVNLKDVNAVSAFHNAAYENALVLASPDSLKIGRVDELQKLQVKTLRLGEEAPRRIVHSAKLKAYGVVFLKESIDRKTGEVGRSSSFKILDDTSFEVLGDFPLDKYEEGRSVACIDFTSSEEEGEGSHMFIVGTGVIRPDEQEAQRGRVMVFAGIGEGQYKQIAEGETRGAVHAIAQLPDGKFAVTSNSEIIVFDRISEEDDGRLRYLCSWGATFIAYKLASKGDLLCAVDPLRSASLVRFDSENNKLVDVAKEFSAYGLHAAAFLEGGEYDEQGSETILAADLDFNLFTAKRVKVAPTASMASRSAPQQPVEKLQAQAMIHTGEVVNTFCKGSLVPSFAQTSGKSTGQLIFGTSVGSIKMVFTLSAEQSQLLSQIERNMRRVIPGVGNLRQADYRAFKTEYRTDPAAGFIDGSFVEELTNLSKEEVELVMQGGSEHETITGATAEEVIRLVEELQRMH